MWLFSIYEGPSVSQELCQMLRIVRDPAFKDVHGGGNTGNDKMACNNGDQGAKGAEKWMLTQDVEKRKGF